jgi:hypothetical protein
MRWPGWRLTTSLGAVVVIAAAVLTAWQLRWPSQIFRSTASARPGASEFLLPRVGTTSVTPYQLGKDLYVNDAADWRRLSEPDRSALLNRLDVAEGRFQLLQAHGVPSPSPLTARVVRPARGSEPGSALAPARNGAVLTSWAGTQPVSVAEDIGAAAAGDSPFRAGGAAYGGLTFAPFLGWVPCASDHTTSFGRPVQICGGQVLAAGTFSSLAGMAGLTVLAKGMAIGQAGLPLLASYTNHSTHAEKVTVTGTVASVTMTLATTLIGAGCHESFLEYGTPARGSSPLGRLVPPLPEPPLINVDDCLGSVHFTAPIPGIQALSKIFSYAQTATTTVSDSLQTAKNRAQLASAPSLKICTTARLAADIAQLVTDLDPAFAASLSCQPRVLPTWTGNVPAGATVQFGVAPVARALSSQLGFEIAGLYSLAHLHVTSQCSGSACPVTTPPPSMQVIAHDEAIINRMQSSCGGFEPASKGCPFAVTSTPDGTGGRVYAIALLATAGDSCAGSIVYFFDGEQLITDTTALPPSTTPRMARLSSPATGRISVVWRVNPAVNTPCYQFASAGTDTYLYGWNGKTMTLLSGNPPQPPKAFPSQGPTSPPTQQSPAPFAVTSSSPTSGPASGGTRIVIHGSGFSSVTDVVMNSIEPPLPEGNPNYNLQNLHPSFSVVSDSEIDVTTTAGAAGFTYEIDFITPTDEYFRNTFPGIPLFTYK